MYKSTVVRNLWICGAQIWLFDIVVMVTCQGE